MKLFFYGNAQNVGKRQTDRSRGQLRMGPHDDPCAVFAPFYETWVWGQLHDISLQDLPTWNGLEAPEFTLRRIQLASGLWVSTYQWVSDDFELYPLIESGRFIPTVKSQKDSMADDEFITGR